MLLRKHCEYRNATRKVNNSHAFQYFLSFVYFIAMHLSYIISAWSLANVGIRYFTLLSTRKPDLCNHYKASRAIPQLGSILTDRLYIERDICQSRLIAPIVRCENETGRCV